MHLVCVSPLGVNHSGVSCCAPSLPQARRSVHLLQQHGRVYVHAPTGTMLAQMQKDPRMLLQRMHAAAAGICRRSRCTTRAVLVAAQMPCPQLLTSPATPPLTCPSYQQTQTNNQQALAAPGGPAGCLQIVSARLLLPQHTPPLPHTCPLRQLLRQKHRSTPHAGSCPQAAGQTPKLGKTICSPPLSARTQRQLLPCFLMLLDHRVVGAALSSLKDRENSRGVREV